MASKWTAFRRVRARALSRTVRRVLPLGLSGLVVLTGCMPPPPPTTPDTRRQLPLMSSSSAAGPCVEQGGWSCQQQSRFDAVLRYRRPGAGPHSYLSVVFVDRFTKQRWEYGPTHRLGWTASTIKLAIAADLLQRQRAGQLVLSATDRHDMDTMLNFSDEAASDRLWKSYGGADMLARFRENYGMTDLRFVPGFTVGPYWGFVKCTAADLSALLSAVFTRLDPADRSYLVAALQQVAPNQQWGVWAAGTDQRPGNKDGWSDESDDYGRHPVANTVGFAGPDQRFLVTVMYQVDPSGSQSDGVHAVSDVVALLFGRPVPARVTVPTADG